MCFLALDKQFVDGENKMFFLILVRVLFTALNIFSYLKKEKK